MVVFGTDASPQPPRRAAIEECIVNTWMNTYLLMWAFAFIEKLNGEQIPNRGYLPFMSVVGVFLIRTTCVNKVLECRARTHTHVCEDRYKACEDYQEEQGKYRDFWKAGSTQGKIRFASMTSPLAQYLKTSPLNTELRLRIQSNELNVSLSNIKLS